MTQPNAFDPSTWGEGGTDDGPPVPVEDLYAPAEPLVDFDALRAEFADLGDLLRSAQAQRDKAQAVADSAQAEVNRLSRRRLEIAGQLSPADDTEDED